MVPDSGVSSVAEGGDSGSAAGVVSRVGVAVSDSGVSLVAGGGDSGSAAGVVSGVGVAVSDSGVALRSLADGCSGRGSVSDSLKVARLTWMAVR